MKSSDLYGGIEAGGTKFVCAVGTDPGDIRARTQFPTTTPDETIGKAVDFFQEEGKKSAITRIGIGSFGPLDLDTASLTYGCITATPKPGWENVNMVKMVHEATGIPVALDTDVNAAALAEREWGAARGLETFIYLTTGTGIGGGGIVNGRLMHGLIHPEMGHIRIPHDYRTDPFPGSCPFHGDCLEGLASGASMTARWGRPPEELPPDHPGWDLEAGYLASGVVNFICIVSPCRIIMGGGVMKHPGLIQAVRSKVKELLKGYIGHPQLKEEIDIYIVQPGLGELSGVLGAIALARGN